MPKKVVSESVFGWCNDGMHAKCPKEYESIYFDTASKKKSNGLVKTGIIKKCNCKCHKDNNEKDTLVKPKRKRNKKSVST